MQWYARISIARIGLVVENACTYDRSLSIMLTSIELHNYRGFSRFRMEGLKRITLLVGKNNTGKTSLLEAAQILAYGTSPFSLVEIMTRRGERIPPAEGEPESSQMDVAHFFHGHTSSIGSEFSIRGETHGVFGVDASIIGYQPEPRDFFAETFPELSNADPLGSSEATWETQPPEPDRALCMKGYGNDTSMTAPMNRGGGLNAAALRRASANGTNLQPIPELFIPTAGLGTSALARFWNRTLVQSKEGDVIEALRIIEPSVKDLQYLSGERASALQRSVNPGFFVGLDNVPMRVPFGSLGDGMKRLLALALASRQARGGYLLVDEIDTGLHYTTLPKMWRLVVETARRFNVQVIATTHSGDCVRSLALLHEEAPELAEDVALHRIEKGFEQSTPFTTEELSIGARQHMEFR